MKNIITAVLLVKSSSTFTSTEEEAVFNYPGIKREMFGTIVGHKDCTLCVDLQCDDNQVPEWLTAFHNCGSFDGVVFVDTRSRVGRYIYLASAWTDDAHAVQLRDQFVNEMHSNVEESSVNCNFGRN